VTGKTGRGDKTMKKRKPISKDAVFNALLTSAVASTYNVSGLRADRALSVAELRKRLEAAGLFKAWIEGANE
jgi:hypothetical protein